jgi:hypothetical protein
MPRSKPLGQGSPLTAVLCDTQNRVDQGQIFLRNIATLARQILLDATELFGIDFQPILYQLVLTGPSSSHRRPGERRDPYAEPLVLTGAVRRLSRND